MDAILPPYGPLNCLELVVSAALDPQSRRDHWGMGRTVSSVAVYNKRY